MDRFKTAAHPGRGVGALVLALSLLVAACILLRTGPADAEPRFENYPAQFYTGAPQPPDLSSHPDARTYRTRLRNAVRGGVNFAGDHVLVTWGCGGQCLMGAVINARSGYVQFLPGTICCWLEAGEHINPVAYNANSNLLVLTGLLNEQEPMAKRYYDFSGREFRLIEMQPLAPHTAGGGQTVTPTCPAGFTFSGGQCVRTTAAAPPPPPPPAAPGQFDIRHGFDLPGGDYGRLPGKVTYTACLSACQRDGRCLAFTFNTRAKACFLKGHRQNWTHFKKAISGVRTTAAAPPPPPPPAATGQFDIRDGFDLPGGDYRRLRGKVTYTACLSACQRDGRCLAFTFNTRAKACFLKGYRQNWTHFKKAISGVRIRN